MPEKTGTVVKHRACDECRSRKLACSKDPERCERCKRENIVCHYSEQKPMGRPRKRQFIESATGDVTSHQVDSLDLSSVPFAEGDFDSYVDSMVVEPYFTTGLSGLTLPPETTMPSPVSMADNPQCLWNFGSGDIMGVPPINFGNPDVGSVDSTTPPLDPMPHLSTDSNNSTSSENSPPQSTGGPGCSCLASMYLSLASLQEFPKEIVPALRTVRSACATAAGSIWCQKCGGPVLLDDPNPPIESFQNIMLLGTILPIIANGYQRLLQMIDDETKAAESLGQMKTFRFHDYGGMCGQSTVACVDSERFARPVEMSPGAWRTTVRALLRVDIYGHEQPGFKHKGLKDLVTEMENRQKTRHAMLEAHITPLGADSLKFGAIMGSAGLGGHGHTKCVPDGQIHGCLQILSIAKRTIDNLTIA